MTRCDKKPSIKNIAEFHKLPIHKIKIMKYGGRCKYGKPKNIAEFNRLKQEFIKNIKVQVRKRTKRNIIINEKQCILKYPYY